MLSAMGRRLTDPRLRALIRVSCRRCQRPAAEGTGAMEEAPDVNEWLIEYSCDACGETYLAWRAEFNPLVRQIAREHAEARGRASASVSGEIGHDGPVQRRAEPKTLADSSPMLLRLRESISELACATRRDFILDVGQDGVLTHEELPAFGPIKSSPVHRDADGLERLPLLHKLFERIGFERLPAVVGRGDQQLEITWYGGKAARTRKLRCNVRGTTRDFAGDTELTPAVVELTDNLWQLAQWVDAGGPSPPWPIAPPVLLFPRPTDLLQRTRAARLSVTHDWDGSARNVHLRELWVAESGALALRVLRQGSSPALEETRDGQLAPEAAREVFTRLADLKPPEFRRQLGFVRSACGLDRTHSHALDWFDGERVHSTSLVFGSESGIGLDYGDTPPRADETTAFDLLIHLMGQV
jgi:hypothetical protein